MNLTINPNNPSNDEPILRYVLYARKSSEDVGAQAKSLPDQIQACVEYAEKQTVSKSSRSLKNPIRPRFLAVSRFSRERSKTSKLADGALTRHPDRLARNSLEAGMIVDMVDNGIIKDLKIPTLAFTNDSSSKLLLNIMFAMSKQYSEHLSESVQRGVNSNIAQGKSGGTPKWGCNRSDVTGLYEPDGNFDYIKHGFKMRLDGHSQADIMAYWRQHDVHRMTKLTRKNKNVRKITTYNSAMVVANILSDPFYYGMLVQGGQPVDLLKITPNFVPMLTEEQFGAVQAILKSLKKTVSASVKAEDDKSSSHSANSSNAAFAAVLCTSSAPFRATKRTNSSTSAVATKIAHATRKTFAGASSSNRSTKRSMRSSLTNIV